MNTKLTPSSKRAEEVIKEFGDEWHVIQVNENHILVESLDGEWSGVFDKTEAKWNVREEN